VFVIIVASVLHADSQQHGVLQVRKSYWSTDKMSAAYLDTAARWSRDLTQMRSRGPGDIENAMRAIEREYGVDYWVQWRLRYRRSALRDIGVTVFMSLRNAYRAECERQMRKLQNEIASTPSDLVAEAEALVREIEGK
jgi:hypothetical protein